MLIAKRIFLVVIVFQFALFSGACTKSAKEKRGGVEGDVTTIPDDAPKVVFLGDSISAGLHLSAEEAFPAVLERRFAASPTPFRLINAGVSGDTTAGGVRRLDWLLDQNPDVIVVELGANDGLRGVDADEIEKNLREIVRRAKAADVKVLILGMKLPPNYGLPYTAKFEALYEKIADDEDVPLVPYFMKGVAGDPTKNLEDGIHPTEKGHEMLADNVEDALSKVLEGL